MIGISKDVIEFINKLIQGRCGGWRDGGYEEMVYSLQCPGCSSSLFHIGQYEEDLSDVVGVVGTLQSKVKLALLQKSSDLSLLPS